MSGVNNTVAGVISEWGLNLISCSKPFTNFKDGLNVTEKRVSLLVMAVISFKANVVFVLSVRERTCGLMMMIVMIFIIPLLYKNYKSETIRKEHCYLL